MGFQSFLANLKGPATIATVHVPESASTENVIREGNLEYTQEKGGNDSLPSYQGVYPICCALLSTKSLTLSRGIWCSGRKRVSAWLRSVLVHCHSAQCRPDGWNRSILHTYVNALNQTIMQG